MGDSESEFVFKRLKPLIKEQGFEVEEEWEMDDNSIEMTVTRWIS